MHELEITLNQFIEKFKFESPTQEKSVRALQQFLRGQKDLNQNNGYLTLIYAMAFVFQKEHESNEWWLKTISDQVTRLENEIALIRNGIRYE